MTTREEAIRFCLSLPEVYEDYPFHDSNWTVMRHKKNKKSFAYIYEREGHIWINVKCDLEWILMWRETYRSVVPAYHMNKKYWNSLILNGTIPKKEIRRMIVEGYDLVKPVKQGWQSKAGKVKTVQHSDLNTEIRRRKNQISKSTRRFFTRFHLSSALKAANAYKKKGTSTTLIFQYLFLLSSQSWLKL